MITTKWVLDPTHSNISFKVKHLMIANVKGGFNIFEGEINGDDFEKSPFTVKIETSSLNTGNSDRDNHLKSADFFETEKFPVISFESISIAKNDDLNFELKGNLTIKGITKEITLNTVFGGMKLDPWGNEKSAFEIIGKINRKDFGLTYNATLEAGGVLIGEEVILSADIEFVKQVL